MSHNKTTLTTILLTICCTFFVSNCSDQSYNTGKLNHEKPDDYYLDFYQHEDVSSIKRLEKLWFFYPGIEQYRVVFDDPQYPDSNHGEKAFYFYKSKSDDYT